MVQNTLGKLNNTTAETDLAGFLALHSLLNIETACKEIIIKILKALKKYLSILIFDT